MFIHALKIIQFCLMPHAQDKPRPSAIQGTVTEGYSGQLHAESYQKCHSANTEALLNLGPFLIPKHRLKKNSSTYMPDESDSPVEVFPSFYTSAIAA